MTDGKPQSSRYLLIAALVAMAFGLTLAVFYPGIWTFDTRYVYQAIRERPGDWQSPVMSAIWGLIDPLAPGGASMFLLFALLYWGSFGLLAALVAGRSAGLAVVTLLLGFLPPAFVFVGVIWRDILFAETWCLAAILAFAASRCAGKVRWTVQGAAFALVALGVLLRPNALIAAPLLAGYALWPSRFRPGRVALLCLPLMIGYFALIQVTYYGLLDAQKQNPQHSVIVFDLGGISHFTRQNQFPVTWSPEEQALLLDGCYKPTLWDIYWTQEPCRFVMRKVEGEGLFGKPALVEAWTRAVLTHPLAYLQHRASFLWNFLGRQNLTLWRYDIRNPPQNVFPGRQAFALVDTVESWLAPTILFRAGFWLLLGVALAAFAWPCRETPAGAFVLGTCGSAIVYVGTFFLVGVASDFRYAYWAVLAVLSAAVVTAWSRLAPAE